VTTKLNSTNYVVKRSSRAKDFIVHGDRLKLYYGEIDASAWPTDSGVSQQASPASAGIASTDTQSSVSQQSPAQLGSAQANDQRPVSGRSRSRDSAGRPACSASNFQPASSAHTGAAVPPATSIHYDNQIAGPISDGGFSASRPKRACRKPARLLSSVAATEICAGGTKQTVPKSEFLTDYNSVDVTELSTTDQNCHLVVSSNRFVDRSMPNKGKRPARKRRRRNSRDRAGRQDGDRPVGICRPRVVFVPHRCRRCQDDESATDELRSRMYLSRNAMNKHTVLKHDSWYQPKRDEFVPIAPEDLERVRARYRSWQSHRPSGPTAGQKRERPDSDDECRPATTVPASTPAVTTGDLRVALERCSTPATSTEPTDEPVPSTSRGPERVTRSRGRGYGILGPDYAASLVRRISATAAEQPASASDSRPPWSSPSDSDEDSDITVLDFEAETDAEVVGWGRFSDISEPGSPSVAATLDRAAARASADAAAAEVSDSTGVEDEYGMSPTLDLSGVALSNSESVTTSQSVSVSAGQSVSVSVEQSVSAGVEQVIAEVAPSTGTSDVIRDAGPTPGAGAVPGIPVEHQGSQELPEQSSVADPELSVASSDVIPPSGDGKADSLTCGQRLPSTRSSSPLNSSFEVIPDSDDNNNDVCRGDSSTPLVQQPVPPTASVGGGAVGWPPLELAGLLAIVREDHLQDFNTVATNLLRRYRSDLDHLTLTRLLQAMSATRMDTAEQIYDGAAFLTGGGTSDAKTVSQLLHFIGSIRRPAP